MTTPTKVSERHLSVDALRGFALLGILIVNIEYTVQPIELGWSGYTGDLDLGVRGAIQAFGATKIYPIFALLFGYGFGLQVQRSGDELWPRYRRRMFALIGLGIMHGIFFFPGDILVLYGLVGLLAYHLRDRPTRSLLKIAAITYGCATAFWFVLGVFDGKADPAIATDSLLDAVTNGSFLDVIVAQLPIWFVVFLILMAIQGPAVIAAYCVGMVLSRSDWLSNPSLHRAQGNRAIQLLVPGVILAVVGAWLSLGRYGFDTLGFAVGFGAAPLLAAGYIALVVRLPATMQRLLQSSGRMSLTVYLFESVLAAVLAMGYGFGWVGRVSPLAGLGLAVAIWAALSAFAHVWMRTFMFGPLEWILRSISYRSRQPLRREVCRLEDLGEVKANEFA